MKNFHKNLEYHVDFNGEISLQLPNSSRKRKAAWSFKELPEADMKSLEICVDRLDSSTGDFVWRIFLGEREMIQRGHVKLRIQYLKEEFPEYFL